MYMTPIAYYNHPAIPDNLGIRTKTSVYLYSLSRVTAPVDGHAEPQALPAV